MKIERNDTLRNPKYYSYKSHHQILRSLELLLYFKRRVAFPSQGISAIKSFNLILKAARKLYFRKKIVVNISILTVLASPIFP
jgi:hypothetical protein